MTESGVSRTLALAWGLAAAPQRGPKRELTLERIVDAAIEIADAEGLPAVTMQRVAKTFEFSTMALYRYVATKDELYQLMLDAAMEAGAVATNFDDWREGLSTFLRSLLDGYRAHPWVLDIPLSPDIHLMPGQLRAADLGLRAMRRLPAAAETKLAVLIALSAYARGHASVEREVLAGGEAGTETRTLLEEAVTPERFPDVAPLVREGAYFGDTPAEARFTATRPSPEDDVESILDFATEVLLAGFDTVFAETADRDPDPAAAVRAAEPVSPQRAYEIAEARLREHVELRKLTQQRVRELEREESALRKARDRAKELAKTHAKLAPGVAAD